MNLVRLQQDSGPAPLALALVATPRTAATSALGGAPAARCPVTLRFRSDQLLLASETSTGGGSATESSNRELLWPIFTAAPSAAAGST